MDDLIGIIGGHHFVHEVQKLAPPTLAMLHERNLTREDVEGRKQGRGFLRPLGSVALSKLVCSCPEECI